MASPKYRRDTVASASRRNDRGCTGTPRTPKKANADSAAPPASAGPSDTAAVAVLAASAPAASPTAAALVATAPAAVTAVPSAAPVGAGTAAAPPVLLPAPVPAIVTPDIAAHATVTTATPATPAGAGDAAAPLVPLPAPAPTIATPAVATPATATTAPPATPVGAGAAAAPQGTIEIICPGRRYVLELSAGGEKEAEMKLRLVVKECATWKYFVKALVGSSSTIIGETYLVGNGIPRLITAASDAPGPVVVYLEMELRWVWSLCPAETTRIANWRQWTILICIIVITGLIIAIRFVNLDHRHSRGRP